MAQVKKTKATKIILFVILLGIVGGFTVNWFLTYRLQSTLNEKLTEEVLKATDGFYRCTFEELSVGLFSGELSIKGVNLEPDSLAFAQWKAGDTLPNVYYKIHLGEIHFRGVNLTWLRNYTNLHFSLFELNSPDVKVVQPASAREKEEHSGKDPKTLYEMVSPYIDELTVNRINLKDANVSYIVDDSISPVVYALRDANFRAFNFRLDKDSYMSGKLLYSDYFEFEADKPQQLLYSDQVILETDNIKLSTIESLIEIEGVKIHPKESFWEDRFQRSGIYLKAEIAAVIAEGVGFNRENAQNYLHASSFNIKSTDIQYFSINGGDKSEEKDSLVQDTITDQAWSLYSLISPILSSIAIDKINIEKTKFNYTLTQKGLTDIYTLYKFDFHANKFLVDSLSEQQKKFWYVDNFVLAGENINGLMESNNSNVSATSLYLNTGEKKFHLANIEVKPLSTKQGKDYMSGGIKRISVDGLDYNTGVSADELRLDTFNIEYFRVSANNSQTKISKAAGSPDDIFEMFNPYADYLSVKKIRLNDAGLKVHDRVEGQTYSLQHLNFYATNFLIDENTRRTARYLFSCDDIGMAFKNFDNVLPGGIYRLQIGSTDVSTMAGRLKFENLRLSPQTDTWTKAPASYYDIKIPLVDIEGFDNEAYLNKDIARVGSFRILSPDINIVKLKDAVRDSKDNDGYSITNALKGISVSSMIISDAAFRSLDRTKDDSISVSIQDMRLTDLLMDKKLNVGKLYVSRPSVNMHQSGSKISFNTDYLSFTGLKLSGKDIGLASFDLIKPELQLIRDYKMKTDTTSLKSPEPDAYTSLSAYFDKANIGRINIEEARIDYSHTLDTKIVKYQEVNTTNLKAEGLIIDTKARWLDVADFHFNTKDLHLPIMEGFYTLDFDRIDLNKKLAKAEISGVKMTSAYPKMEFSYKHPQHKDWFDVSVGGITISGLDYATLIKSNLLKAKDLEIQDVVLQNLKNKQIYTPPKMQPMIYTKIQELPIGLDIDTANIKNFTVIYDELPKDSEEMGRILFEGMSGRFSRLANVASYPNEYMNLYVDGKFMGNPFTARWDMPVSPDYDCFVLSAALDDFDMQALNPIFVPLAKAEVKTGRINQFRFKTEATSVDAHAHMLLLYSNLHVDILKDPETQQKKKFLSSLANMVIRSNNPNNKRSDPRVADIYIERDPYHSSFNYFWQIMQPAMVESVGVSQGKQNFMKKVTGFFAKVKNLFSGSKKEEGNSKELPE